MTIVEIEKIEYAIDKLDNKYHFDIAESQDIAQLIDDLEQFFKKLEREIKKNEKQR